MKKGIYFLVLLAFAMQSPAQDKGKSEALTYLSELTSSDEEITERTMRYVSATAHKSKKSVTGKRNKLLKTFREAYDNSIQAQGFNGDKSLRDAVREYYKQNIDIFSNDYAKAATMSESADETFEKMEAYLDIKDSANKKVRTAFEKMQEAKVAFTDSYGIKLVDGNTKIQNDLRKSNEVIAYYNEIYLLWFKPFKEEVFLTEAIKSQDTEAIKLHAEQLENYANESLEALKEVTSYDNDVSLIDACKVALDHFIDESENFVPSALSFIESQQNFTDAKAAIDAKKRSELTKKEVDDFNALVKQSNDAVNAFNEINGRYFQLRVLKSKEFSFTGSEFRKRHIPYYEEAETLGT